MKIHETISHFINELWFSGSHNEEPIYNSKQYIFDLHYELTIHHWLKS